VGLHFCGAKTMKHLLLFAALLLASLAFAQEKPKKPFAHPNFPNEEEARLSYQGDRETGEGGSVLIVFDAPFLIPPTTVVTGDLLPGNPTHLIENEKGQTIAMTVLTKPHGKIHYECRGVKVSGPQSREKDGSATPGSHGPEKTKEKQ
jgi:hypothetical protein